MHLRTLATCYCCDLHGVVFYARYYTICLRVCCSDAVTCKNKALPPILKQHLDQKRKRLRMPRLICLSVRKTIQLNASEIYDAEAQALRRNDCLIKTLMHVRVQKESNN